MTDKISFAPSNDPHEMINAPQQGWTFPNIAEIWRFRHLLVRMTMRELKVRYKQTILGTLWAILNPLITIVIFTIVFKGIAQVDTGDVPYFLFAFAGLVPWGLFSRGLGTSSVSVVSDANLIRKIYYPRLITPLSKLFTGFVDFLLTLGLFLLFLVLSGATIHLKILMLIPLTVLTLAVALGLSLWFSAIHVSVRDVGYVIPYAIQMGLYLTPVAYPAGAIEEPFRTLYGINPMVTVCEGFRWATVGGTEFHVPSAILSVIVTVILLVSGLFFFNRLQPSFPDRI
jgi:lipopolysaccharide transport system permease protein